MGTNGKLLSVKTSEIRTDQNLSINSNQQTNHDRNKRLDCFTLKMVCAMADV